MTGTNADAQPQPQPTKVIVTATPRQTPDGVMLEVQVAVPGSGFVFFVNEHTVQPLRDAFNKVLDESIAKMRRARLGLMLPDEVNNGGPLRPPQPPHLPQAPR